MSEIPTVAMKIDRFIAQNTFGSYPDEYGDVMRTRDALNVALAKLEGSESRAEQAEEEIEQLHRAAMADEYPAAHQRDIIILRDRAEAAEARAAQAEAERDEARRALEQAQERIKQLERETAYFQSTDFAADKRLAQVERTAPLDWRETETPLGQQLDGGGDEVEQ